MTPNRCRTCRYYVAHDKPEGYGGCTRWHAGYGVEMSEVAANEVLVENDEGWGALMGPDFGCVLHEPKPR